MEKLTKAFEESTAVFGLRFKGIPVSSQLPIILNTNNLCRTDRLNAASVTPAGDAISGIQAQSAARGCTPLCSQEQPSHDCSRLVMN